jgi:hypothetical protein
MLELVIRLAFSDTTETLGTMWEIITDLKMLLQPFMLAQKLLEGQTYVTISLVPFVIYKM